MSARNLLLANICLSNLIIAFLVKPISAVYLSYSLTTGEGSVGLAFCSLYTLSSRTTWLVLPLTTVALCWTALAHRFPCCRLQQGHNTNNINNTNNSAVAAPSSKQVRVELGSSLEETDSSEAARAKRAMAFPTIRQKSILSCIWAFASLYGLAACFPEKVC